MTTTLRQQLDALDDLAELVDQLPSAVAADRAGACARLTSLAADAALALAGDGTR
jgi:hypothetical protein